MISKFFISHCCILSSQFVRQIEWEDYSFLWTPGPKGLLAEGYFTKEIKTFLNFLLKTNILLALYCLDHREVKLGVSPCLHLWTPRGLSYKVQNVFPYPALSLMKSKQHLQSWWRDAPALGLPGGRGGDGCSTATGAARWHAVKQIRGLGHSLKGKEN